MKNEIPITITRAVFFLLFSLFFFRIITTKAQKINKLPKDNKITGIWKKYYTNKRIHYEGTFIDGKEGGVFKYYDITTSKHPTIKKEFSKKSESATVSYFNLDGKLRTKGVMIGKKRVGKWIYFFPNQKLFSEEYYVNGKLEGKLINYYNNGKVLEITEYSKGMKNGFSKKFSDQGVLIEEVNYSNDILNGKGNYYELNGDLKEEGVYSRGKRVGVWEFYIGGKKVTKKDKKEENKFRKNNQN